MCFITLKYYLFPLTIEKHVGHRSSFLLKIANMLFYLHKTAIRNYYFKNCLHIKELFAQNNILGLCTNMLE